MAKLYMPDGREVDQGGPEDRVTWWNCCQCGFNGPYVGTDKGGEHRCMGIICGGVTVNPNVPRIRPIRFGDDVPGIVKDPVFPLDGPAGDCVDCVPNVKLFGTPITVTQARLELIKREKN